MNKNKRRVGLILVIVGALLLGQNIIGKTLFHLQSSNEVNAFLQENTIDKDQLNIDAYKNINIGDKIGIVEIPEISVKHVIVEGTENEQIKKHIGHFENTAMPGENGNFVIVGHNTNLYNEIFKDLNEIKIGQEIIIQSLSGIFKYKIVEKKVIEPTDFTVLNQDVTNKEMTIITCTEGGEKRLSVKAELI